MRAHLVPLDGTPPLELVKELTLIGRKEECDLQLNHKSVSKMHCVIVKTDGLLLLRDLGSTNGTRVNGQRVRRAALLPNDQLAIAGHKFRVHFGTADVLGPVGTEDRTQQLDREEVEQLLSKSRNEEMSEAGHPPSLTQGKSLPDVYPEDEPRHHGK